MARTLYEASIAAEGHPCNAEEGRYLAEVCFDSAEYFFQVANAERAARDEGV